MVGSHTLKKPYTRKMGDEDKKIANHGLSLSIAYLGKDDANTREKTPEYTTQPEEETSKYTPQSDDEMLEDNFDTKSEDDMLINCGIVLYLPT